MTIVAIFMALTGAVCLAYGLGIWLGLRGELIQQRLEKEDSRD